MSSYDEESVSAFRRRLLGSAISTYVVCALIVPLKIWCRVANGRAIRFGGDDIMCIVAFVFASVFFFIGMLGLGPDLGKHVGTEVSIAELIVFLKYLFPEQLLYLICVSCNKFVLLAFYWRLFSIRARVPLLVLMGVVAAWMIGTSIGVVLICDPIAAQWNPTIEGATCSGLRALYLGASVPNILTDFILLVTPLPYVWTLNAPTGQRLMLAGIFLLGCFITVVSSLRLSILMRVDLASADYTWKMKEVLLWSIVEVNVGLVCACLPSLKPAIRLLGLGRLLHRSNQGGRGSGMKSPAFVAEDRFPNSGSRKKSLTKGGLFSSIAGITKLNSEDGDGEGVGDEEEDTYQMVKKSHQSHGTVETSIEGSRGSGGGGGGGRGGKNSHECDGKRPAIVAHRDWSVLIEDRHPSLPTPHAL